MAAAKEARRDRGRRGAARSELVCGIHAVEAALTHAPELALELWLRQDRVDERIRALAASAARVGLAVHAVGRETLDRMAHGVAHQGAVLRRRPPPAVSLESVIERLGEARSAVLLALDGIDDPHNLGACLRTAAAVGVAALVVPRSRGSSVTPSVRRVASGGAERVEVVEVANLARALAALGEAGFSIVGLAGEAPLSLFGQTFDARTVLVVGGEGRGLRRLTRACCNTLVHIPMQNGMQSLNVSVAAGVALYAVMHNGPGARS